MREPGLAIFDLDGVLIDSEAIYLEVEMAFLSARGISVSREWYVDRFMALAPDVWKQSLSALLEDHTGRPLGEEDYLALKEDSRAQVLAGLRTVPGAEAMLDSLHLPACVASSTSLAFLPGKLERAGLAPRFGAAVFSGDMVANGKPAPDLFLHAAQQMGGHDPAGCVVVEDSANGVRGAKAAGMFAVGFLGGSHVGAAHGETLKAAGADLIIGGHDALASWFASFAG